MHVRVH